MKTFISQQNKNAQNRIKIEQKGQKQTFRTHLHTKIINFGAWK